MTARYKTLAEYKAAIDAHKHPGAVIEVDNDGIFSYDQDADEHLWRGGHPRDEIHNAFSLLGLKSRDV